ncbi:hypothetical protein OIO90_000482 [Microbotryomycetes sp. JL221]|nr:hypothetical protein OIO90_000482 [Microbotryomycetes sp. JL221]
MSPAAREQLLKKSADDVVIVWAKRTPLCKARKGGYKDMSVQELALAFFKQTKQELDSLKVDPSQLGDICVGMVLPPKAPYDARASALAAGFPDTVPLQVVNRFCSSGLMAVANIANQVRNDEIEMGLACGFENMSAVPDRAPEDWAQEVLEHPVAKDCQFPMGWTSENVSKDFDITRERMDELAAASHQRAANAQKSGYFDNEIMPIEALQYPGGAASAAAGKDGKQDRSKRVKVIITKDDGIRGDSTAQGLSKIRAAFPQWGNGTTTGGNASQITDGAAGVLLMKRSKAEALGLKPIAKHVATSVAGLAPRIMGIGPAFAIPKVLERTGLSKEDIDLFEVNEAFASMFGYCIDKYGLPHDKTNVNGGAIALGHPLGATGARQVATGLNELRRRQGKILVTSMCIGLGMGAAAVFVNED